MIIPVIILAIIFDTEGEMYLFKTHNGKMYISEIKNAKFEKGRTIQGKNKGTSVRKWIDYQQDFCESDEECKIKGNNYRCEPKTYNCILSYGDCDDACECMKRHKGSIMECITTLPNTIGASRVCVKRGGSSVVNYAGGFVVDAGSVLHKPCKEDMETNVIDGGIDQVIAGGSVKKRKDLPDENEFCESDKECQRYGGDYRCMPGTYRCVLSYGDCEDACECMERHKGTKMDCITTITSTLGASRVCVKRENDDVENEQSEGNDSKVGKQADGIDK